MSDSNVGKSERNQFAQIVHTLTNRQYTALGLLCVRRVRPLYAHYFAKEDIDERVAAALSEAVQTGAENETIGEALREKIEELINELQDSDDTDYPMDVLKVFAASLSRIAPRDWDAPEDIGYKLQDAAASACSESIDQAVAEEAQWQVVTARALASIGEPSLAETLGFERGAMWVSEFLASHP